MRVVSWNLQGNKGIDAAAVAAVIGRDTDLVLLQEVQWRQLRAIAADLGAVERHWSFKHWGAPTPAEGLGVLSRVPIRVRTSTLSRGVWPWQWQRRIMQRIDIQGGEAAGLVVLNTHLATGADGAERALQVERILARCRLPDLVAGDLNEWSGPALDRLRAVPLRDVWHELHGEATCATNWSTEERDAPPDQRLDWMWVADRLDPRSVQLGDWTVTSALSDHVPLVAEFEVAGTLPPHD